MSYFFELTSPLTKASGADRFDGNDYNKIVKQLGRVVSKTANYTAMDDDFVILCDATSGAITVTLPTAAGRKGKAFCIKKIDSSANTVTIDGNASETIDGATTKVLSTQYSAKWIISDGANWVVIASV